MKLRFSHVIILFAIITSITTKAQNCQPNWLSTSGSKIVDVNGEEVILAGVNWFGFENGSGVANGLWERDWESMLQQVQDLGFNCLRIPWSNDNLFTDTVVTSFITHAPDPYNNKSPSNPDITSGETTALEVMDLIVNWCQENDMKIILDNHSRTRDNFKKEFVWYNESVSHEQWINDWKILAERYKDFSAVAGMDLNNEPHGNLAGGGLFATWGSGNPLNDWKIAAEECGNAILEVNPNVLIVIEGVTEYVRPDDGVGTNYWDGGNLQGVRDHKVELSDNTKLVYSPHEYGFTVFDQPWFNTSDYPANLEGIWEENFNFINSEEIAPLLVGEFGIKLLGSPDEIWLTEFVKFIVEEKLSYTYWSLNPNSGDTGGILQDDWASVHQWKMNYLESTLSNPIPSCIIEELVTPPVVVAPEEEEEPEVVTPPVVVEPEEEEESEIITQPVVVAPTITDLSIVDEEELIVIEIEDAEDAEINIYPNPTKNIINLIGDVKEFRLYDLSGRLINDVEATVSENRYEYDLSNLASDIYLAIITSEKGSKTVKVVKE